MKVDKVLIALFTSLFAILLLGLMPRYSIENALTGAAISLPSGGTELWIVIAIIAIAVIVTSITFFLKMRSSKFEKLVSESPMELKRPEMPIEKPRTDKQKIKNYVQLGLRQGKSKSQIRHTLIAVGWPNDVIDKVIREI